MRTKYWVMLTAVALVMAQGTAAYAQLNSTAASVNLNAVMSESLSLSAAPGTVNFTPQFEWCDERRFGDYDQHRVGVADG